MEMYSTWCVEAILLQLSITDEAPSPVLYKALEEVRIITFEFFLFNFS